METSSFKLSLEQEFQVKAIEFSSEHLTREELQETIVDFTRQLLVKENVIRYLIKTITSDELDIFG